MLLQGPLSTPHFTGVLDFSTKYQLNIGGYSGNVGDTMTPSNYGYNQKFTTKDQDNDIESIVIIALSNTKEHGGLQMPSSQLMVCISLVLILSLLMLSTGMIGGVNIILPQDFRNETDSELFS